MSTMCVIRIRHLPSKTCPCHGVPNSERLRSDCVEGLEDWKFGSFPRVVLSSLHFNFCLDFRNWVAKSEEKCSVTLSWPRWVRLTQLHPPFQAITMRRRHFCLEVGKLSCACEVFRMTAPENKFWISSLSRTTPSKSWIMRKVSPSVGCSKPFIFLLPFTMEETLQVQNVCLQEFFSLRNRMVGPLVMLSCCSQRKKKQPELSISTER